MVKLSAAWDDPRWFSGEFLRAQSPRRQQEAGRAGAWPVFSAASATVTLATVAEAMHDEEFTRH